MQEYYAEIWRNAVDLETGARAEGRAEGRVEGHAEAQQKSAMTAAQKMLQDGLDIKNSYLYWSCCLAN